MAVETLVVDEDIAQAADELRRDLRHAFALTFGVPPRYFVVADKRGWQVDYFPKAAFPGIDVMISAGEYDDRNAPA